MDLAAIELVQLMLQLLQRPGDAVEEHLIEIKEPVFRFISGVGRRRRISSVCHSASISA